MKFYMTLLAILVIGCVEKGRPTRPHDPGTSSSKSGPVIAESEDAQIAKIDPTGSVQTMANQLLRKEIILDPQQRRASHIEKSLYEFNSKLLMELKAGRASSYQATTKSYVDWVFFGCSEGLQHCQSISFFSGAKNTAEVLIEFAKLPEFKGRSIDLLLFAFEYKGRRFNEELLSLVLGEAKSSLERGGAKDLGHLLSTAGKQFSGRGDEIKAREIVDKLGLGDEPTRTKWASLGFDLNSQMLLVQRAGGLGAIGQADAIAEAHFAKANSLRTVQEHLLKQNKFMVEHLSFKAIDKWDQATMIYDKAFLGTLDTAQAVAFLRQLNLSREELARRAKQIYQLRFYGALAESTERARKNFFEKTVSGDRFFFHAISSASQVQPVWGDLTANVSRLRSVALNVLKSGAREDEVIRDVRRQFDGLQLNIKYFAVYPQMMALAYHMAKREAKISFRAYTRVIELDSSNLIEWLFLGQMAPWFEYSTDQNSLSFLEILYAFNFALRSGVFAMFEVNPDEFVSEIVERLSRKTSFEIRTYLREIRQRLQGSNFTQFRNLCQGLNDGTANFYNDLKYLRLYPLLGPLNNDIFEGLSAKGQSNAPVPGQVAKLNQGLFVFDDRFASTAEVARLDLENVQRWLTGLLASYKEYLQREGLAGDKSRLKKSETQIEELKKLRGEFFQFGLSVFREVGQCYVDLYKAEEASKLKLLAMEESYLRQVHKNLKDLRAGTRTAEELNSAMAFKGLPSDFTGLDRYLDDGYDYNRIDSTLRMAKYLTEGLQTSTANWPAISPRSHINFGSRLDADADEVRNSVRVKLIFTDSEDEFVAQGITTLISRPPFYNWYSLSSGRILIWPQLIHMMTVFYRLSDAEILNMVCKSGKCAKPTELVSAEQIIAMQESILELVRLTDQDRHFMEMVGINRKIDAANLGRKILDFSIYDQKIVQIWGLYDLPALVATQELLGAVHLARELSRMSEGKDLLTAAIAAVEGYKHFGFRNLGKSYWEIRRGEARQQFMVKPDKALDEAMDREVIGFVRREQQRIEKFGETLNLTLETVKQRPPAQRPRFDLGLTESYSSNLLSPNFYSNFALDSVTFDDSTEGCYSQRGCKSFSQ